ncbi:hypothetical protein [Sphingobacterium detergens]
MNFSIVELYLSDTSHVFIIWGQNESDDFFLIDEENKICGFLSLEGIKNFINQHETKTSPFTKDELINYKQLFSSEINFYSFKLVEEVLFRNTKIEEIGSDDAGILIETYNLISDFFYQTNNEDCLLLRKDKNMEMFFDYCYYKYFWQKGEELLELEKELPSFNYAKFVDIYRKLLIFFVNNIKVIEV